MPPPVAPGLQVRRTRPAIRVKCDWYLGNAKTFKRSFDDHFGGEFHAGRFQFHFLERLTAETAQAAVKILGRAIEKEPPDEREGWISVPSVFPRHGARGNRAASSWQAATHHEFVTLAELFDEAIDFAEIVAHVRVAHDNVFSVG